MGITAVTLSNHIVAEVYDIDVSGISKEIRPGGFKMGTPANPDGIAIEASNNYYLSKGGKPWFPIMGEIHYSRYPRHMWEDAILKMKAGGITTVASYSFWIHHEEIQGEFDFSGQRDLRAFIELCKKHNMFFLLRLGPWCNGEVKHGGHPGWIYKEVGNDEVTKKSKTRSNDPTYLKYTTRLYEEYFKQVKGLFYKEGGPVIGLQLENEYSGAEHLLELKRIARNVGFDVPLYTVTGWNGVVIPEKEVLPVQAGYPESPWDPGITPSAPNSQYLFMTGIPINTGVGTDIMPVLEIYGKRTYNPSDYPWLTAELGVGNQIGYRRRPVVTTQDAVSLMTVKLAGGANALGYYMYFGGTNPKGKLSHMQMGNYPLKSYDFQCAVSEFGETHGKYHEMKLIHFWLQQYGSQICNTLPAMPAKQPKGVTDVDTLRFMTRTNESGSGYLFFSNYQRYVPNKDIGSTQISVKLKNGTVTIPSSPLTIPKDTSGIWPINFKMADINLRYATAQLICSIPSQDSETYFFFAQDGVLPEYAFDAVTLKKSSGGKNVSKATEAIVQIENPGFNSIISLESTSGKKIRICTLTKEQALQTYFIEDLWGKPRVVIADGDVLCDGKSIDIRKIGKESGEIRIFPSLPQLLLGKKELIAKTDGIYGLYNWSLPKKEISVEFSKHGSGTIEGLSLASAVNWANNEKSYFRKELVISDITQIKSAQFVFRANDYLKLWVNDSDLGSRGAWAHNSYFDITSQLQTGKNIIACGVYDKLKDWQGGILVGQLILTDKAGNITKYPVDQSWKASKNEDQGWQKAGFDDAKWGNAFLLKEWGKSIEEDRGGTSTQYSLNIPSNALNDIYDVYLDFDYQGDVLNVTSDNEDLIADWFYYGPHFRPSLKHWGEEILKKDIKIDVGAITPETHCYIEPEFKPDFSQNKSIAEIKKITPIPQYRIVLTKD